MYPVEIGLVGDARTVLRQLNEHLQGTPIAPADVRAPRPPTCSALRQSWAAELTASQHDDGVPIHPARLLGEIAKVAPKDTIYVTDVGWNKNGAGQQLPVPQPQSFITSGGMATMGFAPAAAIGAKIGQPDAAGRRPGRRRRLPVGLWRAHDRRGARHSGRLDHLQQLLLLDDSHGRRHLFQEQLRHGVHDARRQAVQPGLPDAREGVRRRVGARGSIPAICPRR